MQVASKLFTEILKCDVSHKHTFDTTSELLSKLYRLNPPPAEMLEIKCILEDTICCTSTDVLHFTPTGKIHGNPLKRGISILEQIILIIAKYTVKCVNKSTYAKTLSSDYDIVKKSMMVVSRKPILTYSCRELTQDAITQFLANINFVGIYDENLFVYWQLLEYRAYELMTRTGREQGLYDSELYCTNTKSGMRRTNLAFLTQIAIVVRGVRIHFSSHFIMNHVPVVQLCLEERANLIKWIKFQSEFIENEDIVKNIGKKYTRKNLRIGEYEAYLVETPGSVHTSNGALNRHRTPAQTKEINEIGYSEIAKSVKLYIDAVPEKLYIHCVLTEILKQYMHTKYAFNWELFFVKQKSLEARKKEMYREEYPFIIETFGYYQLAYKGRCFEYNSYINSLHAWLVTIRDDFNGDLCGLNVSDMIIDLLGIVNSSEIPIASSSNIEMVTFD